MFPKFRLFTKLTSSNILQNYDLKRLRHTIYSLSSGSGKCGVAVIRVSGPKSIDVVQKMVKFGDRPIKPRYAYYKEIICPKSQELIDKGLVLWFPGPNSFTGEDSCELQVHGGTAVILAVLNSLGSLEGFQPAKPGEFTKRAFYSGKIKDLTEVEGLADLIHAETEAQRKQALFQANGTLAKLYSNWRQTLIQNISHFEAFIDFSEDENIETGILDQIQRSLELLRREIEDHLQNSRGEILKNGVRTVIIGEPNVGKSSFMNLLCQRSIAIVTDQPGTTRDVIETNLNIDGYPLVLMDTAGLRKNTTDFIEKEGIRRALDIVKLSDLVIIIMNADSLQSTLKDLDFNQHLKDQLNKMGLSEEDLENKQKIIVVNKVDLVDESFINSIKSWSIPISCKTSFGITTVVEKIGLELKNICGSPSAESPSLSQSRHRYLLTDSLKNIDNFLNKLKLINDENSIDLAIAASHLRAAVQSLGKISGQVTTDDILDVIFREFCIGK